MPRGILEAVLATPVSRLSLEESTYRAQISLVAKKVSLAIALGPELDGMRERCYGLPVAADERTTKIYVLEAVFLGKEVRDLPDVVAKSESVKRQTSSARALTSRHITDSH